MVKQFTLSTWLMHAILAGEGNGKMVAMLVSITKETTAGQIFCSIHLR